MAWIWEKAISILAGNLNSGRNYLIAAVMFSLMYQYFVKNNPIGLKIYEISEFVVSELVVGCYEQDNRFLPWLEAIASCFRNLPRMTAKTESTGSLALINLVPPIKYKFWQVIHIP